MTEREKIALLEDMFEMDEGELSADTELSELDEWDSIVKLSLIVLMNDEFHKTISGEDIKTFKTIGDILACME